MLLACPAEDRSRSTHHRPRVRGRRRAHRRAGARALGGMNRVDALWPFGRYLIGWPGALTAACVCTARSRRPAAQASRACDEPLLVDRHSVLRCFVPGNIYFVAKSEAHEIPGSASSSARSLVRRAARRIRSRSRAPHARGRARGKVLGVVEGTRQKSGVPGECSPARRWSRCRRECRFCVRSDSRHAGLEARQLRAGVGCVERARCVSRLPVRWEGLPQGVGGDRNEIAGSGNGSSRSTQPAGRAMPFRRRAEALRASVTFRNGAGTGRGSRGQWQML